MHGTHGSMSSCGQESVGDGAFQLSSNGGMMMSCQACTWDLTKFLQGDQVLTAKDLG